MIGCPSPSRSEGIFVRRNPSLEVWASTRSRRTSNARVSRPACLSIRPLRIPRIRAFWQANERGSWSVPLIGGVLARVDPCGSLRCSVGHSFRARAPEATALLRGFCSGGLLDRR